MATTIPQVVNDRFSLSDPDFAAYIMKITELIDDPFQPNIPCSSGVPIPLDDDGASSTSSSKKSEDSPISTKESPATTYSALELSPGSSPGISRVSTRSIDEPCFDDLLQDNRASTNMVERFRSLRDSVFYINMLLFSEDVKTPTSPECMAEAQSVVNSMTKWLIAFRDAVDKRARNVKFIMTLAPFTIVPPQQSYWTCYKQRAELILKYTTRPKQADSNLFHGFVRIFEDYLYIQALKRYEDLGAQLHDNLFDLYSTLLASEQAYRDWIIGMKVIGDVYTKPLMRKLMADPGLQKAILRQQDENNAAHLAVDLPSSLPFRQPSVSTNARLGRSAEAAKESRRNRRQHTV